jgi:hypothetical protein
MKAVLAEGNHLRCTDIFFRRAFQKEVSFRPEQDGFLVLRSGETPVFQDAGGMDLIQGRLG